MIAESYPVLWTGQRAVAVLPDHLDSSNAVQIRGELLSVIDRGPTVLVMDMSATASCDHSGGGALTRAYQRAMASGTDLRLVITNPAVQRVLSITGIDQLASVYPTLEAALAARVPGGRVLTPARNGVSPAGADERPAAQAESARRVPAGVPAAEAAPDTGLGTEIALLDREGVIVSVNHAWQAFAAANQGNPARVGRGMSYLEVCAAAGDDPVARHVGAAIRRALAGDLPAPLAVEVPCHSPDTARWFDMLISGRPDDGGRPLGATVTLSLARSQPQVRPTAAAAEKGDSPQVILRLADEHDRIAAAMNDLLVHRLFSAGLSLQSALGLLGDHPAAGKIWAAVEDLDLAISDVRSVLFGQPAPDVLAETRPGPAGPVPRGPQ